VALEGTTCSDTPGTEDHGQATVLGDGPAISVMDMGSIAHKVLARTLVEQAEKNGIPYQFRRATAGGNDAGRMSLARAGVKTCSLSVPCRYIHSPVSVLDLADLANAVKLMGLFLEAIDEGGFAR